MAAPATTQTAQVKKYENFRYGWMIDFAMNVFYGYAPRIIGQTAPPPETMNLTNVDVAAWADAAQERGVDYATLCVCNEYGFVMYDTDVEYNMTTIEPLYENYGIQPGYDINITQKFVDEFRARGIEPIPYINYTANLNLLGFTFEGVSGLQREETISYYERLMVEMATRFDFKYYWIDLATTPYNDVQQRIYNAIKSVTPDAQILGNTGGEAGFERYPYDIGGTEEHAILGGNINYKTKKRVHSGTTYYVGQEIVATPYAAFSEWYYIDDLAPIQPLVSPFDGTTPWVKLQATDPADFQEIVNEAHNNNIPFCALMMVDRYGALVQPTLDYLDGIDFHKKFFANVPTIAFAKTNISFVDAGITADNTYRIYKVDASLQSYVPGRGINPITGFERNKGYYIIPKTTLNLSSILFPAS